MKWVLSLFLAASLLINLGAREAIIQNHKTIRELKRQLASTQDTLKVFEKEVSRLSP